MSDNQPDPGLQLFQSSGGQVYGKELTAKFSNHFSVSINPYYTRISFGEGFGSGKLEDSTWHTAMVMPTPDAQALMRVLTDMFEKLVPQWEKMQEEAMKAAQAAKANGSSKE
jgi:hypothetical protein